MSLPIIELPVLSVSALTHAIKSTLEGQYKYVAVQGEVTNCKLQSSGHLYFSLKDAGAQIAAVMFKNDLAAYPRLPKDGDQIIVKGALNVYPPNGKYQIIVRTLDWAGFGALLLKLEALKVKLKEKGYFDLARKKSLPKIPKRIGVVTSPTGAVIQDILHVLGRRFSGFQLLLNPVKVQGDGAAQEIANAIRFFNYYQLADVLIVGRGGGSIEDLWAFNEEIVADAIFQSQIPIISAVGHESDSCIADFVADVRAPTPSRAAEMVIAEKSHQTQTLNQIQRTLDQMLLQQIKNKQEQFNRFLKDPFLSSPFNYLAMQVQRLDELKETLDQFIQNYLFSYKNKLIYLNKENEALKPGNQIKHLRERLKMIEKNLDRSVQHYFSLKKNRFHQIINLLQANDPKELLKKGYTLLFSEKDNSFINSVKTLVAGDQVKILLADGTVHSTINSVEKL